MEFCFEENRNGRGAGFNTKIQFNKTYRKCKVLKVIEWGGGRVVNPQQENVVSLNIHFHIVHFTLFFFLSNLYISLTSLL